MFIESEMAKTKGKSRNLSRAKVLAAAVTLADREGIDALSMRALGREVGVEAMSLYNHVKNKDDLLDGIVEHVAGELECPGLEHWKAAMRQRAITAHDVLMRHPWATKLIVSRANVGPNMLRYVDATLGCLRSAGFSWAMCDHVWNAIDGYVYGFTLQRLNFPFEPEEYPIVAAQYLPTLPEGQYLHLRGLTEEVIARRHDGIQHLELGLDVMLDGFERLLDR